MRAEIVALRDDQPLVEGFIEYVFVDAREMTPVEIPAAVRSMLPECA